MAQQRFNCPYCEQLLKFDESDQTYRCPHCGYLGTIEQLSFAEKAINQKFFDERKIEMHEIINAVHQCKFEEANDRIRRCLSSPKYQDAASQFLFTLYLFLVDITGDFDFLAKELKVLDVSRLQKYTQYESYSKLINLQKGTEEEKTVSTLVDSVKKYLSDYAEYKENYKERDIYFLCDNRDIADEIFNKALKGSKHQSVTDYCNDGLKDVKAMFLLSSSRLLIVYIQDSKSVPYADYILKEYDVMTSFKTSNKKQRRQILLITSPVYNYNHISDIVKEEMILKGRSIDKIDDLRESIDIIFNANFTTVEEENRKFSQYDAQIAPMVTKTYLDDEEHRTLNRIIDEYIESLKMFKVRFHEAPQAGYTDDKLRGLKKQFSETKQSTADDLNRWKEKYIVNIKKSESYLDNRVLNEENHEMVSKYLNWCKDQKKTIEDVLGPDGMVKLFGKTKYADIQTVYNLSDNYERRYKELKTKVKDILLLEDKLKTAIDNCEKPYFDAEKLKGMVRMYKEKRENYGKDKDFNNWIDQERKLHYYRFDVLDRNVDEAIKSNSIQRYKNNLDKATPALNTIKHYETDIRDIIKNHNLNQNDLNNVKDLFEKYKAAIAEFRSVYPELNEKSFFYLSKHDIRHADDYSVLEKDINRLSKQVQRDIDEKNAQKKKQQQEYIAKAKANVEQIRKLEKDIIGFIKKPTSSGYNQRHVSNLFDSYCRMIDNFNSYFSRLGGEELHKLLSKTEYAGNPEVLRLKVNTANLENEEKFSEEKVEKLISEIRHNDDKLSDILENPSLTNEEEPFIRNLIDKQKKLLIDYKDCGGKFNFSIKKDGFTIKRTTKHDLEITLTKYRKMKHDYKVLFDDIKRRTDELYQKAQSYFVESYSVNYELLIGRINRLTPIFKTKKCQIAIKYGVANKEYLKYKSLEDLYELREKIERHISRYGY